MDTDDILKGMSKTGDKQDTLMYIHQQKWNTFTQVHINTHTEIVTDGRT